jgi:hypothetical protein
MPADLAAWETMPFAFFIAVSISENKKTRLMATGLVS